MQKFTLVLDEDNEESLLGGSFTGEDIIGSRLTASDAPTQTLSSYYGIRSIPTLM
ncbi:MAG: hypothetical protein F6K28_46385 [Microcoleus sp. SIO2G3]|nr:hypothetical protein [Microcoleus sp. SIO2G3]